MKAFNFCNSKGEVIYSTLSPDVEAAKYLARMELRGIYEPEEHRFFKIQEVPVMASLVPKLGQCWVLAAQSKRAF